MDLTFPTVFWVGRKSQACSCQEPLTQVPSRSSLQKDFHSERKAEMRRGERYAVQSRSYEPLQIEMGLDSEIAYTSLSQKGDYRTIQSPE